MKIGAHLSVSAGFSKALEVLVKIGGNCLQIFSSSPRSWQNQPVTQKEINDFKITKEKLKVDPVYFHASYLINLADEGRIGQLSKLRLINELNLASKMEISGTVVHLGSFREKAPLFDFQKYEKYRLLINNIKEILKKTSKNTFFIIENAGNNKIGKYFDEIKKIIEDVDDERVRICLDTCHLFSSGYSFSNKEEIDNLLKTLSENNLFDRLELWHFNDSKDPFGSNRDRHENIGEGTIGTSGFKTIINHPKTKSFPFIIETPGFDGKGPDKKNLDILKSLVD